MSANSILGDRATTPPVCRIRSDRRFLSLLPWDQNVSSLAAIARGTSGMVELWKDVV